MKELKTGKKKKRRKKKKRSKMSKKEANGENPKNKKPELKYHQCLLREITDIDRHVRQSCDSLAALLQKTRLCQFKKKKNSTLETHMKIPKTPQTPLQIILPTEERTLEYFTRGQNDCFTVSHVRKSKKDMKYLQKTKSFSNKEGLLSNDDVNEESEEMTSPLGVDDVTNWSFEEVEEIADDGLSPRDKYQTNILINDIQKELVSLMEMVPYVSKTVNGLVKIFIHYKDCTSCHDKIRPALPWILSRIQKLVKYLVLKKNKPYTKKSECSHNQNPPKPDNKKEEISQVSKKDSVHLAILQKIEAPVLSGAVPGILIQLEVKPPLPLKKYLLNAKNVKVINTSKKLHHIEEFKESQINPIVQVLKAEPVNRVHWKKKQQIVRPRVKNYFTRLQFVFPVSKVNSSLLLSIKKKFLTVKEIKTPNNSSEFQLYEIEGSGFVEKINEKLFSGKENVLTFPEVLRELLSKSDAKMQVEKVKELEAEVKGLKDLMLEVHKNQIDLNKLMVEKGINSNTIEFSDSSRTVEKPPSLYNEKFTSNESLQNAIDNLRKKCDLKNRMIVTLLKSLQKDVPSEWWEQLLDYAFDESKESEDADSEKAKNFLQQTSVYLIQADNNETSAARQQPRREENSSEERKREKNIEERIDDVMKTFYSPKHSRSKDEPSHSNAYLEMEIPPSAKVYTSPKSSVKPTQTSNNLQNQSSRNMSLILAENMKLRQELNNYKRNLHSSIIKNLERKPFKPSSPSGNDFKLTINDRELKRKVMKSSQEEKILEDMTKMDEKSSFELTEQFIKSEILTEKKGRPLLKSSRVRSENDFNYLEEPVTNFVLPITKDRECLKKYLENQMTKEFMSSEGKSALVVTPYLPDPYFLQSRVMFGPALWEPLIKKRVKNEEFLTGPSPKSKDFNLKSHSFTMLSENESFGPYGPMSKRQELETIPENENSDSISCSGSSRVGPHEPQHLKTRARTFNKNISNLETEFQSFGRLIDKLNDETNENSESSENSEEKEESVVRGSGTEE